MPRLHANNLRQACTFDNYVPNNNQQGAAKAALMQLQETLATAIENSRMATSTGVINLFGGPGVGKTHLLHALLNSIVSIPQVDLGSNSVTHTKNPFRVTFLDLSDGCNVDLDMVPMETIKMLVIDGLFQDVNEPCDIKDYNIKRWSNTVTKMSDRDMVVIIASTFPLQKINKMASQATKNRGLHSRLDNMRIVSFNMNGPDVRNVNNTLLTELNPTASLSWHKRLRLLVSGNGG